MRIAHSAPMWTVAGWVLSLAIPGCRKLGVEKKADEKYPEVSAASIVAKEIRERRQRSRHRF